jgi:hypothetical protein
MKNLDIEGLKILKLTLKSKCALDLSCAVQEQVVGYDEHNNEFLDPAKGAGFFCVGRVL